MLEANNLSYLNTKQFSDEEQRLQAFLEWGLLETETVPIFEAATQTAADFLEVPICIFGFIDQNRHWFKSAIGLSRLGLMNQLAVTRSLVREDSICTYVVENHQVLAINDTKNDPAVANKLLVKNYGIRAYLGAPLMDAVGNCLGAIAVMDLQPRNFTIRDIKFLELMACWSMSEFQRHKLLQLQKNNSNYNSLLTQNNHTSADDIRRLSEEAQKSRKLAENVNTSHYLLDSLFATKVKLKLIAQLTQELRTPLTSVLGMASVVSREVYGPLTTKQKEYLSIIQNSGKHLLSLVNEISELGAMDSLEMHSKDAHLHPLNLGSVDIEMLCQQVINNLEEVAKRREQQIHLSLEPGRSRVWVLDKDKIRQLLYHLVFSVIETATTGSFIRIHVSQKDHKLNLSVSVSHPWLGEGITVIEPCLKQLPTLEESNYLEEEPAAFEYQSSVVSDFTHQSEVQTSYPSEESLRLLLSYYLAELHGGQISLQGTPDTGYRYVVSLPELVVKKECV